MPSSKNPRTAVNPGPGKLPAGVVPAGALMFPPGGGSSAALMAHITNPIDAHMASAIGVNPFDIYGNPILSSVGGVVDGESVFDFINEFKDLIPPHPNFLGYNLPAGVNTGIPNWSRLNAQGIGTGTAVTGGYASGVATIPTHYLVPSTATDFSMGGLVFPADRGVLALYSNTDGNFFNAAATTLVAALYLGPITPLPPPTGIPYPLDGAGGFDETLRMSGQPDTTPTGVGVDIIGLKYRLPYLKDYTPYGNPYANYATDFYRFQLATMQLLAPLPLAAGGSQNWLLVHWRDSFATNLAAIQPANLTLANLVQANCYSATPTAGNFDDNTNPVFNVNRHHVFQDANAVLAPSINALTTTNGSAPATQLYSGVPFVNDTSLLFDINIAANDIFDDSFETGSVASPPDVPTQFASAHNPIVIDFTQFGGTQELVPYYAMNKQGVLGAYGIGNAPQLGDIGEYVNATLAIPSPTTNFTPKTAAGFSVLAVDLYKPFTSSLGTQDASTFYLYNTFPAAGGAAGSPTFEFEGFVDESWRYVSLHAPANTDPLSPPSAPYNSAALLTADTDSLQILGNCLVYPQRDFTVGYYPSTGPDYSGLPGTDGVNHLRRHVRAFDTGIPRNTGTLRLRFLPGFGDENSFKTTTPFTGVETAGHIAGGMIIQVMVPGVTGWLDVGRPLGDPGLSTLDFYGCQTGVTVVGLDVFVTFNTTAFTANNTLGEFPLFVRVSFLNNLSGLGLRLDELAWSP